ncbi:MAG: hypothetical protein CMN30_15680 [Sandaracinus sp.]|nr:hypothetical protein [Sandaracinus sp.]
MGTRLLAHHRDRWVLDRLRQLCGDHAGAATFHEQPDMALDDLRGCDAVLVLWEAATLPAVIDELENHEVVALQHGEPTTSSSAGVPILRLDVPEAASRLASLVRGLPGADAEPPAEVDVDPAIEVLLAGFLGRRRQDVDLLRELLQSEDWDGVRRVAHQLAGTSGGYGFHGLTDIGRSLHDAVPDRAETERWVEALDAHLRGLRVRCGPGPARSVAEILDGLG